MAMNANELRKLYKDLVEFYDEFTDRRGYGDNSPVLLDNAERAVVNATKSLVHNYFMFTEFPESVEVNHRFTRIVDGKSKPF